MGLCISRRVGETVHIGAAAVTVVAVDGKRVRLDIAANADVPIVRRELLLKCLAGQREEKNADGK